jgi:hypothetical protein
MVRKQPQLGQWLEVGQRLLLAASGLVQCLQVASYLLPVASYLLPVA